MCFTEFEYDSRNVATKKYDITMATMHNGFTRRLPYMVLMLLLLYASQHVVSFGGPGSVQCNSHVL